MCLHTVLALRSLQLDLVISSPYQAYLSSSWCISSTYISFFSGLPFALDLHSSCHNLAAQAFHPRQLVVHHHIWGPCTTIPRELDIFPYPSVLIVIIQYRFLLCLQPVCIRCLLKMCSFHSFYLVLYLWISISTHHQGPFEATNYNFPNLYIKFLTSPLQYLH